MSVILYLQYKIRLAVFVILHLPEAIGQKKDYSVGGPRGKARAWSGTHCRKVSHRLVPEAGRLCREWPAGSLRCTASGRRLPWPWEAGWAGHVGKVCREGEKIKSPNPTQHPFSLILVSTPPFSFGYLPFPGRRQLTCSSNSISFSLFPGTRKVTFPLPCGQIRPSDWVLPFPTQVNKTNPLHPSPPTSLLFRQQLWRAQVDEWQCHYMDTSWIPESVCGGQLPGEFHLIRTGLYVSNTPTFVVLSHRDQGLLVTTAQPIPS